MEQELTNYINWQRAQLRFLKEELSANGITPEYGFELQNTVLLSAAGADWGGCPVVDLPKTQGMALCGESKKLMLFFYAGVLANPVLEADFRAYDCILLDYKEITGVRLEADSRRVYEVSTEEVLPARHLVDCVSLSSEICPKSLSLLLSTSRADAQIIRLEASGDKVISNTMHGLFGENGESISAVRGLNGTRILRRGYAAGDCFLSAMPEIEAMVLAFALRVGAIVHSNGARVVDEFARRVM